MTLTRMITVALLIATLSLGELNASDSSHLDRVPADRLISNDELVAVLDTRDNPELERIVAIYEEQPAKGLEALASYFREAFSRRYFFDWRKLDSRFAYYAGHFPSKRAGHQQMTGIHMGLYPASTRWKLPFRNLKGDEVSAYEYRHLARQHKMLDMAFMYHYEQGNPEYVHYFNAQRDSLNEAFTLGQYEDRSGGNGAYESFRAGYRVMNWLQVHAFYLGSADYGWQDQLETIRTLLHTAAVLYEKNPGFRYGNHQTRGVAALAMVSILLQDFRGTDVWFEQAMDILEQHMEKEVNADGFQFERSVHYHIGDINNYFKVLQLARLGDMPVPETWLSKLKAMFEVGIVLARPDRRLPVLQDDTDRPWAESNDMDEFMMLGAILFDDPEINYFAAHAVTAGAYWWLTGDQIAGLADLERRPPVILSTELPQTGYYVMRESWDENSRHMVISAGLSEHKPDHQHGDMLGLVAWANGQDILPNYQVRYFLEDFRYFKNSFAKNVAIVDGTPQGQGWISNKGGTGFGKWKKLPNPAVIAWLKQPAWDFFAGTHDGYQDRGVTYFRKVLFLKGLGWIVRDIFESSKGPADFQQVWQGHYSDQGGGNHHRSTFADGSGLEIVQLGGQAESWSAQTRQGKGNLVYSMTAENAGYTTLLYPFDSFATRLPGSMANESRMTAGGWTIRLGDGEDMVAGGLNSNAKIALLHESGAFLLDASHLVVGDLELNLPGRGDLHIAMHTGSAPELTWLGLHDVVIGLGGNKQGAASLSFKPGEKQLLRN